ncbi:MAG: hypothetical protein R3D58_13660 [Saprospiraceae bacterium]
MTTKQHLLLILCFIIGTILWVGTIGPAMLYFFAVVNGGIAWKREPQE